MWLRPAITSQNTLCLRRADAKCDGYLAARQKTFETLDFVGNLLRDLGVWLGILIVFLSTFPRAAAVSHEVISRLANNFLAAVRTYFHSKISVNRIINPYHVHRDMLTSCNNNKVFNSVVGFISIDMMNEFGTQERPPKVITHNETASLDFPVFACIGMIRSIQIFVIHKIIPPLLDLFHHGMDHNICQEEINHVLS